MADANKTLREAAQAVVDRWDSPQWKDLPHTGEYINALRAALAAQAQAEPLFLLYTGAIDSGGEQDDWDTQANSGKAVEAFCREHPGQTVGLYPFAAPVPAQAQDEPAPVLVRDLAEIIGSNVQTVCRALVALGRPPRSTNMAVSGEEALAVAVHLKTSQQAELVGFRDLLMRSGMALEVVSGEWRESDPTLRVDLARATAAHNAAPQPAQPTPLTLDARRDLVTAIVARLERACGTGTLPPTLIAREFLEEIPGDTP